jgi:transposase
MAGYISGKKQGNKTYYYYRTGYRVKIDLEHSGSKRGSGKSKVCANSVYLGTAEDILMRHQEKKKPKSVKARHFGLIAAAYQTAKEIGLPDILMNNIDGKRADIHRWIYFFVTIINRLDNATSKNKMSTWLRKTILPELMGLDPGKFTSKNFWYATEDVISEKDLKKLRKEEDVSDDLFVGLGEDTFTKIEKELFHRIDQLMNLSPDVICYDTTNFYTYIEEPVRSELAGACNSKDSKHHLKHIGLLMAVEKTRGIPLLSRVYRANRHDSKVFSHIISDLVITLKELCGDNPDLILILDKGNNSETGFKAMSGIITWVGALVPSHHSDLIDLELSAYTGAWKGHPYYRCNRTLMGIECCVILTFNSAVKRKKEHTLKAGIRKLKKKVMEKWESYKRRPNAVTTGIESIIKKDAYGSCIAVSVVEENLCFAEKEEEIEKRRKRFGKNLIFSNNIHAESGYLIDAYHEKNVIEDDFQILKDTTLIRFRPIRHWTDTKIRAYAFCCVVSMTLIRVMQWKVEQVAYKISPKLLKEELLDLQEIIMIYSPTEAERKITDRSAVQKQLWNIFNLGEIENILLQH